MASGSDISKRSHSSSFQSKITKDQEIESDPLFWGPYLSERQWGTVREDYSPDGNCWEYLSYERATTQAYKWGEDGLLGVCDKFGLLCASLALWNGEDPILKERLFGLNGLEGNHGEDVKELYYYLENVPNHNYMYALYKYPQNAFPYEDLRDHGRSVFEPEYEILDTGVFDNNEHWDVHVEYAKPSCATLICRYSIVNKSSKTATLHFIPQFYFRNTWSDSKTNDGNKLAPSFQYKKADCVTALYDAGIFTIKLLHSENVTFNELMFTNNETQDEEQRVVSSSGSTMSKLHSSMAAPPRECGKDGFHQYIINEDDTAIKKDLNGTKFGAWMTCELPPDKKAYVYWQIMPEHNMKAETTCKKLNQLLKIQKNRAEEFYQTVIPRGLTADQNKICMQAISGLLWSKQFYMFKPETKNKELRELHGPSYFLTLQGKKQLGWSDMNCHDVILMPDKWEFPWFAAWDLAIQCVQFAYLDLDFAREQLRLLLSDSYMHPSGQIPGCEFDLGDPNPPIIAWAVWKVHQHEKPWHMEFIKMCYPRLIISYQWWHYLDPTSSHLFGKGFLGLDNIGVFNRSHPPSGIHSFKQADATGWVAHFALTMLQITLEQCKYDLCHTDMAIRFLQDFLNIAKAINKSTDKGGLWHEEDGFYYDVIYHKDKTKQPICVRSYSGIIPLFACTRVSLKNAPMVKAYLMNCDRGFAPYVCKLREDDFFLTLVPYIKLKSVLCTVFSEDEFLSPYGIRSLSKVYKENPYRFQMKGMTYPLSYQPGESDSDMFGGNSNWRGPMWMCINYLFVECMETYSELNEIFTSPLSMNYPSRTEVSERKTFLGIACDLCQRVINLYTPDHDGRRPVHGHQDKYLDDDWKDLVLFYEYFHGDTGRGCGASHQTGWSALYLDFCRKRTDLKTKEKKSK